MKTTMYTVIIPSSNIQNLARCLDRLRDPRIVSIRETPFCFSKAINRGIAAAGTDDVILLNDDALLNTTNGFEQMEKLSHAHSEFGVIAAQVLGLICCDEQKPRPVGMGFREVKHPMVGFVCVYIPRAVIDKVGPLDERFVGYGYDDDDYCRRVRDAGFKLAVSGTCTVEHASLPSTYRSGKVIPRQEYERMMKLNKKLFEEKWKLPTPAMPLEMAPIERISECGDQKPMLSILICGVQSRRAMARELIDSLLAQIKGAPDPCVEILYACDAGQEPVGAKRNRLLAAAKGEFSAFIDDDDIVTCHYVSKMVEGCLQGKDCVGMTSIMTYGLGNNYLRWVRQSPQFSGRTDNGEIITDRASHLCAIRTEIARSVPFPNQNFGEDRAWMDRVYLQFKTWTVIEEPIYFYRFDFQKTCTQGLKSESARLARVQGL